MGEFSKTRESLRIKCRAMEEDKRVSSKKRKVHSESGVEYCSEAELTENSVSPAVSRTSGFSNQEGSSEASKKIPRSPDLENADSQSKGCETEICTSMRLVFSRETTPTSELNYGDSEHGLKDISSSKSKKNSSQPPTSLPQKIPKSGAVNMPSAFELDSFFAAAEKCEQKRFADKYNYDIVKDVPLEGKYQWVRLLP